MVHSWVGSEADAGRRQFMRVGVGTTPLHICSPTPHPPPPAQASPTHSLQTGFTEGELHLRLLLPTLLPSVALPSIEQQPWPRQSHRVLELLLIGVLSSLRPPVPVVTHGKVAGQGGEA